MSQVAYEQPWSISTTTFAQPAWDGPCEAWFEALVREDPQRLIELLEGNELEPHLLTFAAEIAGDAPVFLYPHVQRALRSLLQHPSATVREGALYGLAKLLPRAQHLTALIQRHAAEANERSPGVRRAARSLLDLLD